VKFVLNNQVMRRIFSLITDGRLIYGLGLAFSLFYILMLLPGEPAAEADTIIYTRIALRGMGFALALSAISLLCIGGVLYCKKRRDFNNVVLAMIVLPILPVVGGLLDSQLSIGDTRLFHDQKVSIDDHIYNLAHHSGFNLVLYECDSFGIACHSIYRGATLVFHLQRPPGCDGETHLMADHQTVSLVVDCETVFTYQPPSRT
jgi:hypothetical protein